MIQCNNEKVKERFIPELLSPAGSFEKLKTAILYGADAVYLSGDKYSLRARSDNFSPRELEEALFFAHNHNCKVYVTLNGFLHDGDLSGLGGYAQYLEKIGVDAVIVSDLGAMKIIRDHSHLEIHLSTQASCVNALSAQAWKNQGVSRIVGGREISIVEAGEIKKKVGIEMELFIHGSMCMAYSGHCTISNFTAGRDSNRGGCAHSCRFLYSLSYDHDAPGIERQGHFMSSKDLNGISLIPHFSFNEIDSLKVEGRMKGPLYVATITKIYREALNIWKKGDSFSSEMVSEWENELEKVSHREYAAANLVDKADSKTVLWNKDQELDDYKIVGEIVGLEEGKFLLLNVKNSFLKGDRLEVLLTTGSSVEVVCEKILNIFDEEVEKTKPSTLVKLPFVLNAQNLNLVRQRVAK